MNMICIISSVSTIFYAYNVTIDDVNYVLPLKREIHTNATLMEESNSPNSSMLYVGSVPTHTVVVFLSPI